MPCPVFSKDGVRLTFRTKVSYKILLESLKNNWNDELAEQFENELRNNVNNYILELVKSYTYSELNSMLNYESFINYYKNCLLSAQFEIVSIDFNI